MNMWVLALAALSGLAGCTHYDSKVGYVRFAADPDSVAKTSSPENLSAGLSGCVAADALFLGTEWAKQTRPQDLSNQHPRLEPLRLGYQAANCYEAYTLHVATDPARSNDERVAVTLAAERSVLVVDPDPVDRLERAARLADLAARQFADRGDDDERVDASLRAAWYATRATAPALHETSDALWAQIAQSDASHLAVLQAQAAEFAQMSQSLSGASKGFGGGKSLTATGAAAKMHGPGAKMAGALGTAQKVVSTTQKIVQAGSEIAQLSTQIAEGRADLGVMLKGGMSVLGGVMPQLTQRISLLRNLPAAVDLVQTVDAAASGDAGAGAILLGRMARAFGAKVPQQALNAAATAVTAVQSVAQGNSLPSPADVAAQLLRLQQQLKSGKIDKKTFDLLRSQLPNGGVPAAGGTP